MPNQPFCASGPGARMLVDGPLYQLELVRRTINQVTLRAGKPQTTQIAPRQAGGNHAAPPNHIADLEHAANKPRFGTPTGALSAPLCPELSPEPRYSQIIVRIPKNDPLLL
jgi:hypothetical protein